MFLKGTVFKILAKLHTELVIVTVITVIHTSGLTCCASNLMHFLFLCVSQRIFSRCSAGYCCHISLRLWAETCQQQHQQSVIRDLRELWLYELWPGICHMNNFITEKVKTSYWEIQSFGSGPSLKKCKMDVSSDSCESYCFEHVR